MKLLLIANSFGVNLQRHATGIAKANDFDLDIYTLYIGGCPLEKHVQNINNDSKDYELFINGESTHEFISIREALLRENWDIVSLQQASHVSGYISSYYPYFGIVYDYVKQYCPTAKIAFHKTWAYSGYNTYKYDEVPNWMPEFNFKNAVEMKKGIDECYETISKEYKIDYLFNSGDVAELAMEKFGNCYDDWGFHMGFVGEYLIGLNLIKILSGKKINNVFVGFGLGKDTCTKAVEFINENF